MDLRKNTNKLKIPPAYEPDHWQCNHSHQRKKTYAQIMSEKPVYINPKRFNRKETPTTASTAPLYYRQNRQMSNLEPNRVEWVCNHSKKEKILLRVFTNEILCLKDGCLRRVLKF